METIRAGLPNGTPIELWWQDEARVGQKNKIARRWARRGTRPRAPLDQRTSSVYIFGAICPQQGKGAALVLPRCDTQAMSLHLVEVAQAVAPGAHGVLLMDRAGWHRAKDLVIPDNLTLVLLPARSLSPFISRRCTWWVRRSRSAPVRRSDRNTDGHSSKGKFEVTIVEPRS